MPPIQAQTRAQAVMHTNSERIRWEVCHSSLHSTYCSKDHRAKSGVDGNAAPRFASPLPFQSVSACLMPRTYATARRCRTDARAIDDEPPMEETPSGICISCSQKRQQQIGEGALQQCFHNNIKTNRRTKAQSTILLPTVKTWRR